MRGRLVGEVKLGVGGGASDREEKGRIHTLEVGVRKKIGEDGK